MRLRKRSARNKQPTLPKALGTLRRDRKDAERRLVSIELAAKSGQRRSFHRNRIQQNLIVFTGQVLHEKERALRLRKDGPQPSSAHDKVRLHHLVAVSQRNFSRRAVRIFQCVGGYLLTVTPYRWIARGESYLSQNVQLLALPVNGDHNLGRFRRHHQGAHPLVDCRHLKSNSADLNFVFLPKEKIFSRFLPLISS